MLPVRTSVCVRAPSSLSNLGPGFDVLGCAIRGLGDVIQAEAIDGTQDEPDVDLIWHPESIWKGPVRPERNAACIAARSVLERIGSRARIRLRLKKQVRAGSGLGSSAASAVAGAFAVNALFGYPLSRKDLVSSALEGEAEASGARHGDNVFPCMFGGLTICSANNSEIGARVLVADGLYLAVIIPDVEVLTAKARQGLPGSVPLQTATTQTANALLLVEAFRSGNWERVGAMVMTDRVVEPVRAGLLPVYDAVRGAALKAGAHGIALSGSGPSMFAVCSTHAVAGCVLLDGIEACRRGGVEASGLVTEVDPNGACECESPLH